MMLALWYDEDSKLHAHAVPCGHGPSQLVRLMQAQAAGSESAEREQRNTAGSRRIYPEMLPLQHSQVMGLLPLHQRLLVWLLRCSQSCSIAVLQGLCGPLVLLISSPAAHQPYNNNNNNIKNTCQLGLGACGASHMTHVHGTHDCASHSVDDCAEAKPSQNEHPVE